MSVLQEGEDVCLFGVSVTRVPFLSTQNFFFFTFFSNSDKNTFRRMIKILTRFLFCCDVSQRIINNSEIIYLGYILG